MEKYENDQTTKSVNPNLTPPPGKELSQEGFLMIALRHRWVILLCTLLFLIAGFLYLLTATPIFTSSARLYVEQSGPKIISEYKGVMTTSKNYLFTQSELIKSTPIVAGVVDDTLIKHFKTFAKMDNLVAYLKKALNVSVGRKDDIITISFDSPYPKEAAQIVNAVVDSYVKYHSRRKRSTVSEVLRILQKEKVKREKELSDKFEQMLEFTRTNSIVTFDNKSGHVVLQRLAKLSEALTDAQLATINAKADFEAIRNMVREPEKIKQFAAASPTPGVRIFVNDDQSRLRMELKSLEVELENAKRHCTENHPTIQALRAKIEHTKQQLDEQEKIFADAYLAVMRQRWTTAKQREGELTASFIAQQKATQQVSVKATEYSVLQAKLKRTERLCDILDDRIKELNVTEDTGALNISILEVARPAIKASKPRKNRVMAMVMAMGSMFGCALALLRDWLDYRLRSADEISAVLGIAVLGVIPAMSENQTVGAHSQKLWRALKSIIIEIHQMICAIIFSSISRTKTSSTAAGPSTLSNNVIQAKKQVIAAHSQKLWLEFKSIITEISKTIHIVIVSSAAMDEANTAIVTSSVSDDAKTTSKKQEIVERGQKVHLKPRSIVAEAYRTVRTAIFFGVPKGKAKTILVTSPAPGDGKTTLASNLAITMAKAGQKTLIIDADFRKPMQHNIFEIDREKGLSNVLTGALTLNEAIEPSSIDGLDLLACGPEVPNPSEMLNSDVFMEILNDLLLRYDRLIIDSPPVTAVADSQILAALCDVTLLVLRAESSTRRLSQQSMENLLSVGGYVLGAIVNDVSRKHSHYGYYSGYGRYGRYGGYGHYGHYGYYGESAEDKQKEHKQKVYT